MSLNRLSCSYNTAAAPPNIAKATIPTPKIALADNCKETAASESPVLFVGVAGPSVFETASLEVAAASTSLEEASNADREAAAIAEFKEL